MVDLTGLTQFRFQVNQAVVGGANAKLKVEYSVDQGTWQPLEEGSGTTTEVSVAAAGLRASPFANIAPAARADVYLRITGISGGNTPDPSWSLISVQAK